MNKIQFFYIPFLFTVRTRMQSVKSLLAYIVYFPIIWLLMLFFEQNFSWTHFFLAFLYFYSIYEFGYLQNDCETIKREDKPTLRLNIEDLQYYEEHKQIIYLVRILFLFLFASLLYKSAVKLELIFFPLAIIPVFFVYNIVRSGKNLFIHLLLMMLKHATIVFLTLNYCSWSVLLWLFLYHPLCFFIELSVKGKFGYQNKIMQRLFIPEYNQYYIHWFRFYYQLLFLVLSAIFVGVGVFPCWFIMGNFFYLVVTFFALIAFGKITSSE
jgi:hypothetical protein